MSYEIVELECPGCGMPITTSTRQCPQCFREIVISTFHSVASMTKDQVNKHARAYRKALAGHPDQAELNLSLAFCNLKLGLYEKALGHFEKALEDNVDDAEAYFYAAVCLLNGKRPYLLTRAAINQMEQYLSAAISIEPKGIYYYFLAYLKYDFYHLKHYRTSPSYEETFGTAQEYGLSQTDVIELYEILGTEQPECLFMPERSGKDM